MVSRYLASVLAGVALPALVPPAPAQVAPPAATPAAEADPAETGIGDIVVTAQRREERAQTVPVAVTVLDQQRLRELTISQPQDLYGSVPSLVVGTQGQASREVQSYTVRGIATGFLSAPAVAIYVNEVPVPSTVALALQGGPGQFVDLENVQVLAGPQGTLFGRNTTGGAVLLTPRRPSNTFNGYVEGQIGNYALGQIEGALNVPLIDDTLMVRGSFAFRDRDGFTDDLVWNKARDNQHWWAGRVGVLFKPVDHVQNYLLAYGARSSNDGTGFVHGIFNIPGLIGRGFCVEQPVTATQVPCAAYRRQDAIAAEIGPRKTRQDIDAYSRISTWGVVNTTDVDLSDALRLRNIVSYQRLSATYAADQDGTPFQLQEVGQNAALPGLPIAGFAG